MKAGICDLLIQQGETFNRTITPMVTKTSVRASVSTQALEASTSIVFATGGLGSIAIGDFVQFTNKTYKVTAGVADLSLGGTITIDKPLTEMVEAGASVQVFSSYDLTGFSARASIRPTADSTTLTVAFTCLIVSNQITISLTDTETSAIPTVDKQKYSQLAKYTWDLEIEALDGTVTRLLNGIVTVSPEVTRP